MNRAALLAYRKRRDPNQHQTILPEGKTVLRVRGDFEKESPIPAPVDKAARRRPLDRHPANDQRPRTEQKIGGRRMLLLASSLDSLNLPELPLRNDEWKAPPSTQFRNGLADSLQRLPPTLKSLANECSLHESGSSRRGPLARFSAYDASRDLRRIMQNSSISTTDSPRVLPDPILSIADVARDLHCSKAHVYKAIDGQVFGVTPLPAIKNGPPSPRSP